MIIKCSGCGFGLDPAKDDVRCPVCGYLWCDTGGGA